MMELIYDVLIWWGSLSLAFVLGWATNSAMNHKD
jgi:hypothetical protein